ncbi:X2-like carbohydrate binding domain-containing protein [Gilvimarinus japonicus]|uniref:mannan endo-1,4-beta-mannosidase n=1 Tax=Gilvimarinus japonicus TaxID=1796469 RepID=A0ABV7HVZ2_9GAMM
MKHRALLLASSVGLIANAGLTYAASCDSPAYDSQTQYVGGELVRYNSAEFKAKWWIKDTPPDRNSQWGPWGFVGECDDTNPITNSVMPLSQSYTQGSMNNLVFTVEPDSSVQVLGIVGASAGSDYALSGSQLSLYSAYLDSLALGANTLTVDFSDGNDVDVSLQIEPADAPQPSVSPTSISVNKASVADVTLALNSDGADFAALAIDGQTLGASDYTRNANQVTLYAAALSALDDGSHTLSIEFTDAADITVTISVTDVAVTDEQILLPEQADLSLGAVLTDGQVDLQHGEASWSFNVPQSGEYLVEFDVNSPYGEKANTFVVGNNAQQVTTADAATQTIAIEANLMAGTESVSVLGSGNNWGYVFVEQIRINKLATPPQEPEITPLQQSFVVGSGDSLAYNFDAGSYNLQGITVGTSVLSEGVDYTVTGGQITLLNSFLSTLSVGEQASLEAEFYDAEQADSMLLSFVVHADSAPIVEPDLSRDEANVSVSALAPVTVSLNEGSFTFDALMHAGESLTVGADYTFNNGSLTLTQDYLATLPVGSTALTVALSDAEAGTRELGLIINVIDLPATADCYGVDSVILEGDAQLYEDRAKVTGENGSAAYWEIPLDKAGLYELRLTYSTEGGDKFVSYRLDDGGLSNMSWLDAPVTDPSVKSFVHNLSAGIHTVGLVNREGDWGWVNVHQVCPVFMGSLDIHSPAPFAELDSGDISVDFSKQGNKDITYSVNDGPTQLYSGESPLLIPGTGDGIYDIELGLAGTTLKKNLRVQVGDVTGTQYVDTLGTQFVLGNQPFYFNGSNQYYLMYKPEAMAEDFFKRAQHLGMKSVRTWMFCNDTKTHDGVCINMKSGDDFLLTKSNRTAEEQAIVDRSFELFDNYVALAHEYDVKLVLSLADEWNYFGNLDSYGASPYANAESIANFKAFISALLSHYNDSTGYTYAEDPAIMMWEIANEPRCKSSCNADIFKSWAADISGHIKSLAPNHLVSIGAESSFNHNGTNDDFAFIEEVNDVATIDAISAHLYPTWWNMSDAETLANFDQLAAVGRNLNKPTYIGEFSWPVASAATVAEDLQRRTEVFIDWYAKAEEHKDVIGGMLAWQLSGKEWGNGNTPLDGCQWCAGPYGAPTDAWTANNDGFQMYCAITPAEQNLTETGAPGQNAEGNQIHIDLHKPVCDLMQERSSFYQSLNNQ